MKIAVYTIAKNEEKNVDKFMNSCTEADVVIVGVDVRSTDNTKAMLKERGAIVIPIDVQPWRFDVARNEVLKNVPQDVDVCVAIDLDETLNKGWRKLVEDNWEDGLTLMNYTYIYLWQDDAQTIPGLTVMGYKIHARHTHVWQNAVHENLKCLTKEKKKMVPEIIVEHHPDLSKDRSYIKILDEVVESEPDNSWMRYVRGRDHFTSKRYEKCIIDCKEYLKMTKAYVDDEISSCRAECCRMIARSLQPLKTGSPGEIQVWMLRAVGEYPNQRENWVYLAEAWFMYGNLQSSLAAFINAININDRRFSSECEERCWDNRYVNRMITDITKAIKRRK